MDITGSCHCGKVHWHLTQTDDTPATICNCTVCHRYGAIWAYGYEGEGITMSGETRVYTRDDGDLGFHFCPTCGCVVCWRGMEKRPNGRVRMAVNLRMGPADAVADWPLRLFDGLGHFTAKPADGRRIRNLLP